jgi:serine/threonine protein kinase
VGGGHDAPFHEVNFFHINFVGPIGGGYYGNVYEAYMKGETHKVAVKILKKDLFQPEKAFKREVEALKRTIKSPYTVNLKGITTAHAKVCVCVCVHRAHRVSRYCAFGQVIVRIHTFV